VSAPVTVAVVSWNTRERLGECLGSLAPEAQAGRAEVWVVDNGSDDGSPELVESEFPWASLVRGANIGFGPAINEVVRRTAGEWVAAANADVRLRPGALERLVSAGRADPRAGAVAPRLVMPDGSTQHSVELFPAAATTALQYLHLHLVLRRLGDRLLFEGAWDPDRPRTVDWAHFAFVLLRRTALGEIGGFDPGQWLFAEDIDVCWRLRRAGWSTRYEPTAVVEHAVSAATGRAFDRDLRARQWAGVYGWVARRRGWAQMRVLALVHVARDLVWLGLLAPARSTALRERRARIRADLRAHAFGLRSRARIEEVR
jgi:GT2 family glycosyltransferase